MTSLNNIMGTIRSIILCLCVLFYAHALIAHETNANHHHEHVSTQAEPSHVQSSDLEEDGDIDDESSFEEEPRRINTIIVSGNKHVPTEAILDRIPFRTGEIFEPYKTRSLIHNLYYDLKRFRNITVKGENIGDDRINIHIIVDEKKILKDVVIEGNKQVTRKEIDEKLHITDLPAIDEEELKKFVLGIKKIYMDKGFHQTEINATLRIEDHDKATAIFTIKEKPKALLKRILFKGNHHMSGKKLRGVIFSREDWIGSFLDKAGTYQPERVNGDKHMLEQFYQNNGYLNAKVIDTEIITDEKTKNITIIYEIREGDCYTIKEVSASGNDILKEEYLMNFIPIRPGDLYSRERIIESIKNLEFIWGDLGYIYAHIDPSIQPDEDAKTVSLSFNVDLGNQVYLNKINIRGNKKTRDKIIRRKISLEEGGLITNAHMEASKNRIESLGFFDQRDGVAWKTTRLSATTADLDLILKEIKTGDAHFKLGFGGSAHNLHSSSSSVSVEGNISDTNFGGSGIAVNLATKLSTDEKTVVFNITQPWLFDKPIYGALDIYHKRFSYDQFTLTQPVNEKHTGGHVTTGFVTGNYHRILNDCFVRFGFGIDDINYGTDIVDGRRCPKIPRARIPALCDDPDFLVRSQAAVQYDVLLSKLFEPGMFVSVNAQLGQDKKNHPMHPSSGIAWLIRSLLALPSFNSNVGFGKIDVDVNWYTPLIDEFNLVFRLHSYLGIIVPFKNKIVPYRELFHIGGPASVRGYLFGQIGPQFTITDSSDANRQDSIGGDKAFFVNAELIFPILADYSMKGVLFYDGGTGWDNPYAKDISRRFIVNNSFDYRHAIGVGFRTLSPVPLRIDWGFKLDPRKNEAPYEVHFGMSYDW